MKNVKMSTKLVGGFVFMAVITLAVGLVGWMGLADSQKLTQEIKGLEDVNAGLLQSEIDHLNWARKVGKFQRNENMTVLEVEKNPHDCAFGKWYYGDKRKQMEADIPGVAPLLKQIEEPHIALHKSTVELEKLLQKGQAFRDQAIALYQNETGTQLANVQQLLGKIRPKVENHLSEEEGKARSEIARIKMISVSGMIFGVVVALILGVFLSLSITRTLRRIITGLNDGSGQVRSASGQLAETGQQLAEGASEQAAGIEETSSSLEEMSSMTKQNAEHAAQCKTLMQEAKKIVAKVDNHINDMAEAIGKISQSSEDTVKIVKTIDEIAFQTNLLALNAAVEAARAGEAGAGFAVVADEVRNLAMSAAEAAKNTTDLIDHTIKTVREGNETMGLTMEAFQKNKEIAGKVDGLVEEIAAASQEQAQGIEQIGKAVTEMDQVVQQNAANAEESASASEELSAQAEQMNQYVEDLAMLVGGGKSRVKRQKHVDYSFQSVNDGQGDNKANHFKLLPHKTSVSGKKGNGSVRRNMNQDPTWQMQPRQIIPLNNEDVDDF